jgi:hypothetical protein
MEKYYQTSGKNYYMKVLLIHHPTIEDFEKFVIKNDQLSEHLHGDHCYILSIFGDLKKYVFHFKFKEVNNAVDIKIKKVAKIEEDVAQSVRYELEGMGLLSNYTRKIKDVNGETGILVYDISGVKSEIPSFIKQAISINCESDDVEKALNIVLIKDLIGADVKLINSEIVSVLAKRKEKIDISDEMRKQPAISVDLKNMLNPYK